MKFTSIIAALGSIAAVNSATVSVSYDTVYDKGSNSMTSVACSDGANGLITKYVFHLPIDSIHQSLITFIDMATKPSAPSLTSL